MSSFWNTTENLLFGSNSNPNPKQSDTKPATSEGAAVTTKRKTNEDTSRVKVVRNSPEKNEPITSSALQTLTSAAILDAHGRETATPSPNKPQGVASGWWKSSEKSGGPSAGRGRGSNLPAAVAEGLARHKAHEQLVYKQKYSRLKRMIKDIVLENAALCDLVSEEQQKVVLAMEERKFLLRKLSQYQATLDHNQQLQVKAGTSAQHVSNVSVETNESRFGNTSNAGHSRSSKLSTVKRRSDSHVGPSSSHSAGSGDKSKWKKNRSNKPKKLCPPITLDSAGRPIFPIALGPLTIHSLGDIVAERDTYHTEHVIYPVGFCSSRTYASLSDPTQSALYTCKILDGGMAPQFEVVCEEEEESVFTGKSPSECHNLILHTVNKALGMDLLTIKSDNFESQARGLRFFGLTHPSVQNVLQACPGARKCTKYKWVRFEVCRSEAEVESVFEAEREASLCHEALLRNIRFAGHHVSSNP